MEQSISKKTPENDYNAQLDEITVTVGEEGKDIVNSLRKDPEGWNISILKSDERFDKIEKIIQNISIDRQLVDIDLKSGKLTSEEAEIKLNNLKKKRDALPENEDFSVWKAYNELQRLRSIMTSGDEFKSFEDLEV